ncbi:uncharacterized protein IL334_003090 [Kwoniella shivajii]|uniref:Uncharacterized protein n=1 Tax=Kwoniella shivajii TaxID=564305 RepID=A0ABZ1CXQ0_9TREE|nr:hypothetical protein IL334_003090 [Kwoniella shivajii]
MFFVSSNLLPLILFLPYGLCANSQYEQGSITIPTSTVLSIGLGFLAFAIGSLMLLCSIRMNRLRKQAKRMNKPFREIWEDEGGFWGFLTSFGDDGNHNHTSFIGATGRSLNYGLGTIRLLPFGYNMNDFEEIDNDENLAKKKKPVLWDYDYKNYNEDDIQPVSITSSSMPTTDKVPSPLPVLNLCVLISLPSETPLEQNTDPDELPQMIIGSTTLLPIITAEEIPKRVSQDSHISSSSMTEGKLEKKGEAEIQQIEYAYGATGNGIGIKKRAEWKGDTGSWYIEGLKDD